MNNPQSANVGATSSSMSGTSKRYVGFAPEEDDVASSTEIAGSGVSGVMGMMSSTGTPKIEVTKKSLIGQMMDPMNRNKSQQVVVIENMVKSVADLVEIYKNRDVRIEALEKEAVRLASNADWAKSMQREVEAFIAAYKEEMTKATEELKSAAAIIAAIPAAIDGDRGVIEAEIQPAAPLMRTDVAILEERRER